MYRSFAGTYWMLVELSPARRAGSRPRGSKGATAMNESFMASYIARISKEPMLPRVRQMLAQGLARLRRLWSL